MKQKTKNIIQGIVPIFEMTDSFTHPMPNEISVYLDNGTNVIDLNLKEGLLTALAWEGKIELDIDVDFIYKYLEELLKNEYDLTQRYYDEESYNEQTNYFIR